MTVELSPAMEELIRKGMATGAYSSADQFVEEAVRLLVGQDQWLLENGDAISAKIDEGWESARRGELYDEGSVKEWMEVQKKAWREQNPSA